MIIDGRDENAPRHPVEKRLQVAALFFLDLSGRAPAAHLLTNFARNPSAWVGSLLFEKDGDELSRLGRDAGEDRRRFR